MGARSGERCAYLLLFETLRERRGFANVGFPDGLRAIVVKTTRKLRDSGEKGY
jgi:hypothetical protein